MYYTNCYKVPKTFHGVTFQPGETKEVNGYINLPKFVRVKDEDVLAEKPDKSKQSKPKSESTAKSNQTKQLEAKEIKEEDSNGTDNHK